MAKGENYTENTVNIESLNGKAQINPTTKKENPNSKGKMQHAGGETNQLPSKDQKRNFECKTQETEMIRGDMSVIQISTENCQHNPECKADTYNI